MELIAIIIIASLILIVFGFVYTAKLKTRKQLQLFSNTLKEMANRYQLTWSQTDISLHRALAWDEQKRTLLFLDMDEDKDQGHLIDMNDIGSTQLYATGSALKSANTAEGKDIMRLELHLFFKNREKDPVALLFYSEMLDGQFEKNAQVQKAAYWKELISKP